MTVYEKVVHKALNSYVLIRRYLVVIVWSVALARRRNSQKCTHNLSAMTYSEPLMFDVYLPVLYLLYYAYHRVLTVRLSDSPTVPA